MIRLALGTVQFGMSYGIANRTGQVARSEAKAMLRLAADNGLDILDTAVGYGDSEACLGEVGVKGFKVVTKLPPFPEECPAVQGWVSEQVDASLTRLGVKDVYGLLLHRPEQLLGRRGEELYRSLQQLKESGKVQKIGVSIYSPQELTPLVPRFTFELVQAPFNLVDRRLQSSGWLQRLTDEGVEIHTRSAFLQGLLLLPLSSIPPKFAPWHDLFGRWQEWLGSHKESAVQACLAFALSFPGIDRVVVGADSVVQLEQIIAAAANNGVNDLPDLHCDDERLVNPAMWAAI